MAQSDARFGYKAKLSREVHDLSRPFGFTAVPGMLLPIFADIASPGDSYYIKHDLNFLRTCPLQAPAMIDCKIHYESFFVPMQMIYQPFENTFFSLKNVQSSNYTLEQLLNAEFPCWNLSDYVWRLYHGYETSVYHADAFRLFDMLDLSAPSLAIDAWESTSDDAHTFTGVTPCLYYPSFFPWQLLAYHTIFQYYFRLDDKSQFDNKWCNWDRFYNVSVVSDIIPNLGFTTIHQRPWDFDYYTSMYRSPIVSQENLQKVMPNQLYSSLNYNATLTLNDGNSVTFDNDKVRQFGPSGDMVTTANIRQLFANEKLAMITGRTKKNYDSQVLAHFGVKVPHDVKHDLTLIGRDTYQLRVHEVTSLATTSVDDEVTPLGELAGKATAVGDGKQHKFVAPCHGVIMTLFSIEPVRRYGGFIGRQNMVQDAFDLPMPEFDRLGNMPMFRYEIGNLGDSPANTIIGWKERYYYWKRRSPKVSMAFMQYPDVLQEIHSGNAWGAYFLSYWPFGTKANNSSYPQLENKFYIERNCLNDMVYAYYFDGWHAGEAIAGGEDWNKDPYLAYARDPFIVDSFEKVKKVSWLSKDGEPVYPY